MLLLGTVFIAVSIICLCIDVFWEKTQHLERNSPTVRSCDGTVRDRLAGLQNGSWSQMSCVMELEYAETWEGLLARYCRLK